MEDFCIMAYITSNRSPGDERIFRRSIDSDMPPVKSTSALVVCPPIPMLSQLPCNLTRHTITTTVVLQPNLDQLVPLDYFNSCFGIKPVMKKWQRVFLTTHFGGCVEQLVCSVCCVSGISMGHGQWRNRRGHSETCPQDFRPGQSYKSPPPTFLTHSDAIAGFTS